MVEVGRIQGIKIFDQLSVDELQSIANICYEKEFKKNEIAVRQGGVDESINILIEGQLQTEVEIPGFKDFVSVYTLSPTEVFGELAFILGIPRSATVRCISDAKIISLERSDFDKLCKTNPNIERIVMKNLAILLSERLRDTTIKLRDGISRLPSRVVSRKARSIFSELADWINSIKGFSSV